MATHNPRYASAAGYPSADQIQSEDIRLDNKAQRIKQRSEIDAALQKQYARLLAQGVSKYQLPTIQSGMAMQDVINAQKAMDRIENPNGPASAPQSGGVVPPPSAGRPQGAAVPPSPVNGLNPATQMALNGGRPMTPAPPSGQPATPTSIPASPGNPALDRVTRGAQWTPTGLQELSTPVPGPRSFGPRAVAVTPNADQALERRFPGFSQKTPEERAAILRGAVSPASRAQGTVTGVEQVNPATGIPWQGMASSPVNPGTSTPTAKGSVSVANGAAVDSASGGRGTINGPATVTYGNGQRSILTAEDLLTGKRATPPIPPTPPATPKKPVAPNAPMFEGQPYGAQESADAVAFQKRNDETAAAVNRIVPPGSLSGIPAWSLNEKPPVASPVAPKNTLPPPAYNPATSSDPAVPGLSSVAKSALTPPPFTPPPFTGMGKPTGTQLSAEAPKTAAPGVIDPAEEERKRKARDDKSMMAGL